MRFDNDRNKIHTDLHLQFNLNLTTLCKDDTKKIETNINETYYNILDIKGIRSFFFVF